MSAVTAKIQRPFKAHRGLFYRVNSVGPVDEPNQRHPSRSRTDCPASLRPRHHKALYLKVSDIGLLTCGGLATRLPAFDGSPQARPRARPQGVPGDLLK